MRDGERLRIGTDRIDCDYELLFALRFFSDWFGCFFFLIISFLLWFLTPAGVPPRQCVLVLMASWCSVSYQFCRGLWNKYYEHASKKPKTQKSRGNFRLEIDTDKVCGTTQNSSQCSRFEKVIEKKARQFSLECMFYMCIKSERQSERLREIDRESKAR